MALIPGPFFSLINVCFCASTTQGFAPVAPYHGVYHVYHRLELRCGNVSLCSGLLCYPSSRVLLYGYFCEDHLWTLDGEAAEPVGCFSQYRQADWHVPAIPATWRLKQGNGCKFKASLRFIARYLKTSRPTCIRMHTQAHALYLHRYLNAWKCLFFRLATLYVLFRLKKYSNRSLCFCSTQSKTTWKVRFSCRHAHTKLHPRQVAALPQSYTARNFHIKCIISVLFEPITMPVVV